MLKFFALLAVAAAEGLQGKPKKLLMSFNRGDSVVSISEDYICNGSVGLNVQWFPLTSLGIISPSNQVFS